MFSLLCFAYFMMLLVSPAEAGTTARPLPHNRQELIDYWVAVFFRGSDCLTAQDMDSLWDNLDSDDDGLVSVQEFHDNNEFTPILGEPYGARAIFIYHDKAMGEPDGIVNATEESAYDFHFLDYNGDGCVTQDEFRTRVPMVLDEETIIRDTLKAVQVGR